MFKKFIERINNNVTRTIHFYTEGFQKNHYYENIISIQSFDEFNDLIGMKIDSKVETEIEIKFNDFKFGTKYKKFVKSFGRPNYAIDNSENIDGHVVLFYRHILGDYNILTQYHFIDNKFFYGMYELYDVEKKLTEKLFDILKFKYKFDQVLSDTTMSLTDPSNNKILINNNIAVYMHYITGDKEMIEAVTEASESNDETKDLTDYKYFKDLYDKI